MAFGFMFYWGFVMLLTTVMFIISIICLLVSLFICMENNSITEESKTLFINSCLFALLAGGINSIAKNKSYEVKYKEAINEIARIKASKAPKVPKALTPTLDLKVTEKLAEVAGECNVAKVTIISGLEGLSDQEANKIIKDCKIFKLQKELQDD